MGKKALILLSGGLDNSLAAKLILDQGLSAEAVHFSTPFCNCDKCSVEQFGTDNDITVHHLFQGQDFLDLLVDPPHGYGSHMNICIDCRINMFKKAKELADHVGAEYLVTGEIVGQRPFSQRKTIMELIEREAGLEGKILRPLSAKLLKKTKIEEEGIVDRGTLKNIQGRSRKPQMQLAKEVGVYNYPCPSGGCLLTDPQFSKKLEEYLNHGGKPSVSDMFLLRLGRHFRINGVKIIVGRDQRENRVLGGLAKRNGWGTLTVSDYMGPTTILLGTSEQVLDIAAAITVRYSDAPSGVPVQLSYELDDIRDLVSIAMPNNEVEVFRV
jgi:tRNA U34 2-thiouridine synthase MnmA/TrmU